MPPVSAPGRAYRELNTEEVYVISHLTPTSLNQIYSPSEQESAFPFITIKFHGERSPNTRLDHASPLSFLDNF